MTHSRKRLESSSAAAWSTGRFSATMPPKAETGSQARARAKASASVRAERHAARRVVLDDDAGGLVELLHRRERRLEVEEVVVAELLALEDLREGDGRLLGLAGPRGRRRRPGAGSRRSGGPGPSCRRRRASPGKCAGALSGVSRDVRYSEMARVVRGRVRERLLHEVEAGRVGERLRSPRPPRPPARSRPGRRRRPRAPSSSRRSAPSPARRCRSPRRTRRTACRPRPPGGTGRGSRPRGRSAGCRAPSRPPRRRRGRGGRGCRRGRAGGASSPGRRGSPAPACSRRPGRPAGRRRRAPCACRRWRGARRRGRRAACAKGTRPVLSETERSARRTMGRAPPKKGALLALSAPSFKAAGPPHLRARHSVRSEMCRPAPGGLPCGRSVL